MNINSYTKDEVVVLEPVGKLMIGRGVRELDEKLSALLEEGQKDVIIDMQKTAWFGSAVISTLIDHHAKFAEIGGIIKLANLTEEVQKIITVTRLITIFEVHDSLQAALDSFKK